MGRPVLSFMRVRLKLINEINGNKLSVRASAYCGFRLKMVSLRYVYIYTEENIRESKE